MDAFPESLVLPQRTLSGSGVVEQLGAECAVHGPCGLLVHGRSLQAAGVVDRLLAAAPDGVEIAAWTHPGGEPTLDQLGALLGRVRELRPDWMAAVGGGSVMDVAKAAAGLSEAPGDVEVYHDGEPLPVSRMPFAAAPATAGTGSEATTVSVLTNARTGVKKSIRHASHMPWLVLLDPDLLARCPPPVIASSGMDAFTQAVEAYVSNRGTWLSEALAFKAAALIADNLFAVHGGAGAEAALGMLQGSYMAGLALAMARLGLVHGLAHPLGSRYHQPHGLVCGVCLPHVVAFNYEVARIKYERLRFVLGRDVRAWVDNALERLDVRSPFAGQPLDDLDNIVAETLASGSTAANPRTPSDADLRTLLEQVFARTPQHKR